MIEDIEKIIKDIDNKDLIHVKVEEDAFAGIIDFNDLILLTYDGTHQNEGWKIYYHPELNLVMYDWSRWQGAGSYYSQIKTEVLLDIVTNEYEEEHFNRHFVGLIKYIALLKKRSNEELDIEEIEQIDIEEIEEIDIEEIDIEEIDI